MSYYDPESPFFREGRDQWQKRYPVADSNNKVRQPAKPRHLRHRSSCLGDSPEERRSNAFCVAMIFLLTVALVVAFIASEHL